MYTIANNYQSEIVIKNSKFITLLYKTHSVSDINMILDKLREEYPDASHYCYGYIIDNMRKSSDDGEPSGTAGIPILKVLEANNLNNILAVVIRYFGGIKLGANGLIRAYTKSVAKALQEITLKELIKGVSVNITFSYNQVKDVDYLLKDININSKEFSDYITYNINIPFDYLKVLDDNNIKYTIIREIDIEK